MKEIISEDEVHRAVDYLVKSATDIGAATAAARLNEALVKVVLAEEMKKLDGSIAAREMEARTSKAYRQALENDAAAARELATAKALREAASARIEVWRSQNANFRATKF
jgi:hypothetical protein